MVTLYELVIYVINTRMFSFLCDVARHDRYWCHTLWERVKVSSSRSKCPLLIGRSTLDSETDHYTL